MPGRPTKLYDQRTPDDHRHIQDVYCMYDEDSRDIGVGEDDAIAIARSHVRFTGRTSGRAVGRSNSGPVGGRPKTKFDHSSLKPPLCSVQTVLLHGLLQQTPGSAVQYARIKNVYSTPPASFENPLRPLNHWQNGPLR